MTNGNAITAEEAIEGQCKLVGNIKKLPKSLQLG